MSRLLWIVALVFVPSAMVAQSPAGTIAGTVMDASGAVMAGVPVRATNMETGVAASSRSNESGRYQIPFLPLGVYKVTAEMRGFKAYVQENLEVRIADSLDLTIRLQVGSNAETITVDAAAAPVLDNSTTGLVIEERRLLELPQKGGDPFELMRLEPGAANMTDERTLKSDSPEGTSQISVNGSGSYAAQFQIDGINNTVNDAAKGYSRVAFIPPSSAIMEFKMQANPFDAAAGHVLGPVVTVSTKSGTNELHGTGYYWLKNSALDATDFFVNKAAQQKPEYQDGRSGVTIGGPVFIPRLYNGRNKTFFFYSWEENRYSSPATNTNQTFSVPTAAERTGDFSKLLAISSRYQIYNPFSTQPATNGRYQRTPFAGNVIPKSVLNTAGVNLAAFYPLPNQPGTVDDENNFFHTDVRHNQSDSNMWRIDHSLSDNNRVFARMSHYTFEIPKSALGTPASTFIERQINQGLALDEALVLTPSLVLNLRYGFTAAEFPEWRATAGIDLGALGFSPAFTSLVDSRRSTLPRIAVSPFATLSNWSLGDGNTSAVSHNWSADATKLSGSHSLRFGADFRLMRTFGNRYPSAIAPDFSFSTTYTVGPLDNASSAPVGQQLAALLMGIPGGSMTSPATACFALQNKYLGLYLQDDWKLSRTVTLDVGLRYEMEWPVTEKYDRLVAGFDFNANNPIAAQAAANYAKNPITEIPVSAFVVRGGLTFADQNHRNPYNGNGGEWLPRIGLAWQVTPKTVIRTGYGIYFGSLGVDTFLAQQTGFSQSTPIQASRDTGVTYQASVSNPFPNGLIPASGASGGLTTALGQSLQFYDPNMQAPYSQRWTFGVQRFLPGRLSVQVSYVGNRVTHIAVNQSINETPANYLSTLPVRDKTTINYLTANLPNPFNGINTVYGSQISRGTLLEPFPEFGSIQVREPLGFSWYHALQARLEKRFSNGLTLGASYTRSRFMQATEFLNAVDTRPYRSISDMDRPNLFSLSSLWEIPFGRSRRFGRNLPGTVNAVIGNWQFNVMEVHQSGTPLAWGNVIFNGNIADVQLPNDQHTVDRWFNTNAGFERNSSNQLSNNLRTFPLRFNGIRSDGRTTWHASLLRNYQITERLKAQFRAEIYNILNHPIFAAPSTSVTSTAFGTVTNAVSEPRGVQFSLKLVF